MRIPGQLEDAEALIDELHLAVAPCLLGTGRHLFDGIGTATNLELIDNFSTPSGALLINYRVTSASADA